MATARRCELEPSAARRRRQDRTGFIEASLSSGRRLGGEGRGEAADASEQLPYCPRARRAEPLRASPPVPRRSSPLDQESNNFFDQPPALRHCACSALLTLVTPPSMSHLLRTSFALPVAASRVCSVEVRLSRLALHQAGLTCCVSSLSARVQPHHSLSGDQRLAHCASHWCVSRGAHILKHRERAAAVAPLKLAPVSQIPHATSATVVIPDRVPATLPPLPIPPTLPPSKVFEARLEKPAREAVAKRFC